MPRHAWKAKQRQEHNCCFFPPVPVCYSGAPGKHKAKITKSTMEKVHGTNKQRLLFKFTPSKWWGLVPRPFSPSFITSILGNDELPAENLCCPCSHGRMGGVEGSKFWVGTWLRVRRLWQTFCSACRNTRPVLFLAVLARSGWRTLSVTNRKFSRRKS